MSCPLNWPNIITLASSISNMWVWWSLHPFITLVCFVLWSIWQNSEMFSKINRSSMKKSEAISNKLWRDSDLILCKPYKIHYKFLASLTGVNPGISQWPNKSSAIWWLAATEEWRVASVKLWMELLTNNLCKWWPHVPTISTNGVLTARWNSQGLVADSLLRRSKNCLWLCMVTQLNSLSTGSQCHWHTSSLKNTCFNDTHW